MRGHGAWTFEPEVPGQVATDTAIKGDVMSSLVRGRELAISVVRDAFTATGHETVDWGDRGFLVTTPEGGCTLVTLRKSHGILVFLQRWEINAAGRYLEALEYANRMNDEFTMGRLVLSDEGWLTIDHTLLVDRGLDLRSAVSSFGHFVNAAQEIRAELPADLEPDDDLSADSESQ